MIKEIKLQRMKYDINIYLSSLINTRHSLNTYYYCGESYIINKSHMYKKLYFNERKLFETLPSNIDIDLFLVMVDEQINIERYKIVYKPEF